MLIARTSGPFGNVPLPPKGVLLSSLSWVKSRDALFPPPPFPTKENTVSPGIAAVAIVVNVKLVDQAAPATNDCEK